MINRNEMGRKFETTKTPKVGTTDKVTMVREFLAENYEIRINEFDTSEIPYYLQNQKVR